MPSTRHRSGQDARRPGLSRSDRLPDRHRAANVARPIADRLVVGIERLQLLHDHRGQLFGRAVAAEAEWLRRQCPQVAIGLLPVFNYDLRPSSVARASPDAPDEQILERRSLPCIRYGARVAVAQAHAPDAPAGLLRCRLRQLGALSRQTKNRTLRAGLPDLLGEHREQLGGTEPATFLASLTHAGSCALADITAKSIANAMADCVAAMCMKTSLCRLSGRFARPAVDPQCYNSDEPLRSALWVSGNGRFHPTLRFSTDSANGGSQIAPSIRPRNRHGRVWVDSGQRQPAANGGRNELRSIVVICGSGRHIR